MGDTGSGAKPEFVHLRHLAWAAPAALAGAVGAVLVVRFIAVWLLEPPPAFSPLGVVAPVIFTVVSVSAAIVVFALVACVANRPFRTYRILAFLALVASLVPTFSVGRSSMAGAGWTAAGALIIMHVVAWAVTVEVLTRTTTDDH